MVSDHSKRICILSLSNIPTDARVLRQVEWARREYDAFVVGWGNPPNLPSNTQMYSIDKWVFSPPQRALQAMLLLGGRANSRLWERWYWRKPDHIAALSILRKQRVDLIHANEAISLPIAIEAAAETGSRVLFDAHEYTPEQRADSIAWRILAQPFYTYLIRQYAPQANKMITVAQGIAERYQQEFGLGAKIIRNAPALRPIEFHPTDPDHIRLVHHGAAIPGRRIEQMIEVVREVDDRFSLDFILLPTDQGYLRKLKRLAKAEAPGKVNFKSPVPPNQITEAISSYDIGIHLMPPVNFNHTHALPNKFFDFIMAGLALAIGPSVEMTRICQEYQLGIVAPVFRPESLASLLNSLTAPMIDRFKRNSLAAAKSLNAEVEMKRLMTIYAEVLEPLE